MAISTLALALLLPLAFGGSSAARQIPMSTPAGNTQPDEVATAARQLLPLLRDVRRAIDGQVTAQPAALPPSPFTGRSSTIAAVRVGWDGREVSEDVIRAMDRLLAWNPDTPLVAADRALAEQWLEALRIKVVGRMAASARGVDCDQPCVVLRLSNPDTLFGATPDEQRATRDRLLVDAFVEAVESSPDSPR